jgi:hypothetical protein
MFIKLSMSVDLHVKIVRSSFYNDIQVKDSTFKRRII